jgi:hypothetical protein
VVAHAWLRHPLAQRFSEVLFRPGEGMTVYGDHGVALNIFEGFDNAAPGDVEPFLAYSKWLFQTLDGEDAQLPLRLMAYKAQNPEKKIPLALVMVGLEGSGKSLWGEIIVEAFGPYGQTMTAETWLGRFNGWIERCLVGVVDEAEAISVHQNSARSRALISQLRFPMEDKFRPSRVVMNYGLFILNSNKRALGSFGFDDRRMIVVNIPPKREKAFYDPIVAWRSNGGASHLMHWLLTMDLKGWTPPHGAPMTIEKSLAYTEGMTPIQRLADDMRRGDANLLGRWFMAAEQWARLSEGSTNMHISGPARATLNALPNMRVRPWYTPAELSILFPMVLAQSQGRFGYELTSGQLSRYLREAGIPYLIPADRPDGFMVSGKLEQYLVITDFDEWREPLKQADFERLLAQAPTVAQLKVRK